MTNKQLMTFGVQVGRKSIQQIKNIKVFSEISSSELLQIIKNAQSYRVILQGPMNGEQKIFQVFKRTDVQANNLQESILFNQYIFTKTSQKAFPQSFLPAEFQQNQQVYILSQPHYKQTLHEYIKSKTTITQSDALQIFAQLLKSIYSLTINNLVHRNIRPEHFALVGGQWKLRAAVFTSENYGVDNQFTINAKYQAPEQYEHGNDDQLDPCPIIVWNLGSILLDMIVGSHVLNNQKVLKKFKNQQFTLKSIGANKKMSYDLESRLGLMLHYNPQKRMKLWQIYQNPFFSKEVAKNYKQNKQKATEAIKLVAQGPGLRSSMKSSIRESMIKGSMNGSKMIPKSPNLLNISNRGLLQNSNRGLLSVPNNQVIKSSLRMLDIDANASRQNLMASKRTNNFGVLSMAIQQQDQFFLDLAQKTKIIPKPKRIQQQLDPSLCTIQNTQWLKNIFSIYKTFIDRSQLLCVSVHKFSQIPYQDKFRREFILLNEFSVYYVSLIELQKIIQSINKSHNLYKINGDKFDEFLRSSNFQAFKQEINALHMSKKQVFEEKASLLLNLPENQKNLMNHNRFVTYVQERNIYNHSFNDIKKPYRQILKLTYDKVSLIYNSRKQQHLCRLSLYTVYCMTIDKLYIQEDMEDNFLPFIQWNTQSSTKKFEIDGERKFFMISVSELQRYFDTAPVKTLIEHSKKILRKYYKV